MENLLIEASSVVTTSVVTVEAPDIDVITDLSVDVLALVGGGTANVSWL